MSLTGVTLSLFRVAWYSLRAASLANPNSHKDEFWYDMHV
jgi:hypothetical protein